MRGVQSFVGKSGIARVRSSQVRAAARGVGEKDSYDATGVPACTKANSGCGQEGIASRSRASPRRVGEIFIFLWTSPIIDC